MFGSMFERALKSWGFLSAASVYAAQTKGGRSGGIPVIRSSRRVIPGYEVALLGRDVYFGTLMRRESIDFFGHGRRRLALADCDVMGVEGVMHANGNLN